MDQDQGDNLTTKMSVDSQDLATFTAEEFPDDEPPPLTIHRPTADVNPTVPQQDNQRVNQPPFDEDSSISDNTIRKSAPQQDSHQAVQVFISDHASERVQIDPINIAMTQDIAALSTMDSDASRNFHTPRNEFPRCFSFSNISLGHSSHDATSSPEESTTTASRRRRHRRSHSLTPASGQTLQSQHNPSRSPATTPYSIASSVVASMVAAPSVVLTSGLSDHSFAVSHTRSSGPPSDESETPDEHEQYAEATAEEVLPQTAPTSLVEAALPVGTPPDDQEALLVNTDESGGHDGNNNEEVEVDLDAELARLEEQFLAELGQPMPATTSTPRTDDTPYSSSDFDMDDVDQMTRSERKTLPTLLDEGVDVEVTVSPANGGRQRETEINPPAGNGAEMSVTEVQLLEGEDPDSGTAGIVDPSVPLTESTSVENRSFAAEKMDEIFETVELLPAEDTLVDAKDHSAFVDPMDELFTSAEMSLDVDVPVDANNHIALPGEDKGEITTDASGPSITDAATVDDVQFSAQYEGIVSRSYSPNDTDTRAETESVLINSTADSIIYAPAFDHREDIQLENKRDEEDTVSDPVLGTSPSEEEIIRGQSEPSVLQLNNEAHAGTYPQIVEVSPTADGQGSTIEAAGEVGVAAMSRSSPLPKRLGESVDDSLQVFYSHEDKVEANNGTLEYVPRNQADDAIHEAMAFIRDLESDERAGAASQGGASTPMSDFLSAAGSLDETVPRDEEEASMVVTQDTNQTQDEFHDAAEDAEVSILDQSVEPMTDKAEVSVHGEVDRGEANNGKALETGDTIRNEAKLPGQKSSPENKMGESFGSIGEHEIFDYPVDFLSEQRTSQTLHPTNFGTLPDESEISFTSTSRDDMFQSAVDASHERDKEQRLSNQSALDELREDSFQAPLVADMEQAFNELVGDRIVEGKEGSEIFRSQRSFGEGDRRRVDFSAVSSVTSTSSPSTLRMFQATGIISPIRVDESRLKLRTGHEEPTRPPLFPRVLDGSHLQQNSSHHQTASVAHDDSSGGFARPSLSQFLKKTNEPSAGYNAEESVFALMDDSSSSSRSAATDSGARDEDFEDHTEESSFLGDMESTELSQHDAPEYHAGAAIWNMLSKAPPSRPPMESKRPEFVVMPFARDRMLMEADNLVASPSPSIASEPGNQRRLQTARSQVSDTGIRCRSNFVRRGRLTRRRLRRTKSFLRRQQDFRVELQKVLNSHASHATFSPDEDGELDSSIAGGSLATNMFGGATAAFLRRSYSSPDLRILEKTPAHILTELQTASPESPLALQRRHSEDMGSLKEIHTVKSISDKQKDSVISTPRRRPDESPDVVDSIQSERAAVFGEGYAHFDESEFVNDETRLEMALKEFSEIPRVNIQLSTEPDSTEQAVFVASIRWRQLVARFSHNEVFNLSLRKPTSIHLDPVIRSKELDLGESTGGVAITKNMPFELELQGQLWRDETMLSMFANRDGLPPHDGDPSLPRLTQFFTTCFGNTASGHEAVCLRHPVFTTKEKMSIHDLLRFGSELEATLVALMEHLASFAVETDFGYLPCAVSLKDSSAALSKATSKYNGDYSRVLDLLRGRIIFPDEGSLVCALVKLFQLDGSFMFYLNQQEKKVKLRVVRIKNLFLASEKRKLPTGYRHILLNILLDDRFVVEIQCNLLSLFAVMGDTGPDLHLEIRKMEDALKCHSQDIGDGLLIESIESKSTVDTKKLTSHLAKARLQAIHGKKMAEGSDQLGEAKSAHSPEEGETKSEDTGADDHDAQAPSEAVSNESQSELEPKRIVSERSPESLDNPLLKHVQGTENKTNVIALDDVATPRAGRKLRIYSTPAEHNLAVTLRTDHDGILDEKRTSVEGLTVLVIWKCLVQRAVQDMEGKPRDIPSLHCFLLILDFILLMDYQYDSRLWLAASGLDIPKGKQDLLRFKEALLRRSLAIGYQDSSVGMIGWVATTLHGNSTGRIGDRTLEVLQDIGACLAEQGRWAEAAAVHRSLVLQCERYLPLYHPMTLSCMLDLAVSSAETSQTELIHKIVARVTERVASYLAEMEHLHTVHYQQSVTQTKSGLVAFEIDSGRRALPMLEAFMARCESLEKRRLMGLLPPSHEVLLAQKCILADCSVVIANCWALTELSGTEKRSTKYWEVAFSHYRSIFRECAKIYGLEDAKFASVAYGCARCLRELGKVSEALSVLTPVAKALARAPANSNVMADEAFSFMPEPAVPRLDSIDHRMVAAQCQWLLAALTADNQPDDEGRKKALKCLQKASIVLRRILDSTNQDDPRHRESMRLLQQIEEEARRIFHPLGRLSTPPQTPRVARRG